VVYVYGRFRESSCLLHQGQRASSHIVRFEVFTAVTMKNGVFWDVMPCGSCKNRLGISSQRASVAS
jgi:hypothetical protein